MVYNQLLKAPSINQLQPRNLQSLTPSPTIDLHLETDDKNIAYVWARDILKFQQTKRSLLQPIIVRLCTPTQVSYNHPVFGCRLIVVTSSTLRTGRRHAGEGVVREAAPPPPAPPDGVGEVGTRFSRLPALLLPLPDSIVMVMLSSFWVMLTIVGNGDSHFGIVIIESGGCGLPADTVIDSGAGSSFLDGGGGIMP